MTRTFVAEYDVNVGGRVEHELQRVGLGPVDRLPAQQHPGRRPDPRRRRGRRRRVAAGAGGRGRVATGGQVAVDGPGLAHRRHPMTHDRCVGGGRPHVVGGRADREVDDGEVDALAGLGVQAPRTARRAAAGHLPTAGGGRIIEGWWARVDQVAVTRRHLDGLGPWTAALAHRLAPRHCTARSPAYRSESHTARRTSFLL